MNQKPTNSRLITYPSQVENSNDHKVILIDPTADQINDITGWLRTSLKNYDVYLYEHDQHDLEYLNYISNDASGILVENNSRVTASHGTTYSTSQELIDWFFNLDNQKV